MASFIENGFGLTLAGYNRPNLTELFEMLEIRYKTTENFGSNFSFASSPDMYIFLTPLVKKISECLEQLEQSFFNNSYIYASGNFLDVQASIYGISRKQATQSSGVVTFVGIEGTTIEAGQQIKSANEIVFFVTNGGTIDSSGTLNLNVLSLNKGIINNVAENTLNQLVTSLEGVDSVNNFIATTGGTDKELDIELRARIDSFVKINNLTNVDGIATQLKGLSNITDALVLENDTLTADADGVPAKSIAPYVLGTATDAEIATELFNNKTAGIQSFGSTNITVTDSQGVEQNIGFTKATQVDIYVKITVVKTTDYPSDGDIRIKESITNVINGTSLNRTIYTYNLLSAITALSIAGIQSIVIEISKDNVTFVNNFIEIQKTEFALTDTSKVVIS